MAGLSISINCPVTSTARLELKIIYGMLDERIKGLSLPQIPSIKECPSCLVALVIEAVFSSSGISGV